MALNGSQTLVKRVHPVSKFVKLCLDTHKLRLGRLLVLHGDSFSHVYGSAGICRGGADIVFRLDLNFRLAAFRKCWRAAQQ